MGQCCSGLTEESTKGTGFEDVLSITDRTQADELSSITGKIYCSERHVMEENTASRVSQVGSVQCDYCSVVLDKEENMGTALFCSKCNFDVCQSCYKQAMSRKQKKKLSEAQTITDAEGETNGIDDAPILENPDKYLKEALECKTPQELEQKLRKSHQICVDALGEDHVAIAASHKRVAFIYFKKLAYYKTVQELFKAIAILDKHVGKDDPLALQTRKDLDQVNELWKQQMTRTRNQIRSQISKVSVRQVVTARSATRGPTTTTTIINPKPTKSIVTSKAPAGGGQPDSRIRVWDPRIVTSATVVAKQGSTQRGKRRVSGVQRQPVVGRRTRIVRANTSTTKTNEPDDATVVVASNHPPNQEVKEGRKFDTRGVSVHYLKEHFMAEVEAAGFTKESKIYEIENLTGPPGVIRRKGLEVVSEVDGKHGAAYVHCLKGEDNVGEATFMLSYGWGYRIGDVVSTLTSHCQANSLDPKRTYIWMCCLCINQHRVVEQEEKKRSGMLLAPVDFLSEFQSRVSGIGHVLAMMAPWDEPLYLKRVWCIFEIFTASQNNCQVTIVMPPDEQNRMSLNLFSFIGNIDKVYESLANTHIENAEASVEADRVKILGLVETNAGYLALNKRVNQLIRKWIHDTVVDKVNSTPRNELPFKTGTVETRDSSKEERMMSFEMSAKYYHNLAFFFMRNGDVDLGLDTEKRAMEILQSAPWNGESKSLAFALKAIGNVHMSKGEYGEALKHYQKALEIEEKILGENDASTATTYNNIGSVFHKTGKYDAALSHYNRALSSYEACLGPDNPQIAHCYSNIGGILQLQRKYDESIQQYKRALELRQSFVGENSPDTALCHDNIGSVLIDMRDNATATKEFEKALEIRQVVLGENHPETARSYANIGKVKMKQGDYEGSEIELNKALSILTALVGSEHPETVEVLKRKAGLYDQMSNQAYNRGDYDGAIKSMQAAINIRESTLGKAHRDVAHAYNNLALIYQKKQVWQGALFHFSKSIALYERMPRPGDFDVLLPYQNKANLLYKFLAKYDQAIEMFRKVIEIRESLKGKWDLNIGHTYNNIGMIYSQRRKYEEALADLRKAQHIYEVNKNKNYGMHILDNIGCALYYKGDYEAAEGEFRKALALCESMPGNKNAQYASQLKKKVDDARKKQERGDPDQSSDQTDVNA